MCPLRLCSLHVLSCKCHNAGKSEFVLLNSAQPGVWKFIVLSTELVLEVDHLHVIGSDAY